MISNPIFLGKCQIDGNQTTNQSLISLTASRRKGAPRSADTGGSKGFLEEAWITWIGHQRDHSGTKDGWTNSTQWKMICSGYFPIYGWCLDYCLWIWWFDPTKMNQMDQTRDFISLIYGEISIGTMISCMEIQLGMMIIPSNPQKDPGKKSNIHPFNLRGFLSHRATPHPSRHGWRRVETSGAVQRVPWPPWLLRSLRPKVTWGISSVLW